MAKEPNIKALRAALVSLHVCVPCAINLLLLPPPPGTHTRNHYARKPYDLENPEHLYWKAGAKAGHLTAVKHDMITGNFIITPSASFITSGRSLFDIGINERHFVRIST